MNGLGIRPKNGISLCAGGGGLDLALGLAEPGYKSQCYVENDIRAQRVLLDNMRSGSLAEAPIWDDVEKFNPYPYVGWIDTLLGGYPCQPFSASGLRLGEEDVRHLWPAIATIVSELEPRWCFFENVDNHIQIGGETVLRDLSKMGYDVASGLFSAEEIGAPHRRKRLFIVAHAKNGRWDESGGRKQREAIHTEPELQGCELALADNAVRRSIGSEGNDSGKADTEEYGRSTTQPGSSGAGVAADHGQGDQLADADSAGHQDDIAGSCHAPRRQIEDVLAKLRRGAGLFPPAYNDHQGWYEDLQHSIALAPSLSIGDIKIVCDYFALCVDRRWLEEKEAQRELCRMVDGLARRLGKLFVLGNGVCPLAGAYAFRTLSDALGLRPVDLDPFKTGRTSGAAGDV